jgi:putative acetyltransferase
MFAKFLIREFTNKDSNSVFNLILNIVDKEFNIKVDLNGLDSDLVCLGEYYNRNNGGCLYVAEIKDGNKIIGTAAIRNLKQFHSACELKRMFVSKEYRKLGIGQGLLDVTLDFARRAGYSKILLYSSSDLKAARNLYLKNGFEDMKRYNDDYRADVFMQRHL